MKYIVDVNNEWYVKAIIFFLPLAGPNSSKRKWFKTSISKFIIEIISLYMPLHTLCEQKRRLKQARKDYRKKVEEKLQVNNTREVWREIRTITGYIKNSQATVDDVARSLTWVHKWGGSWFYYYLLIICIVFNIFVYAKTDCLSYWTPEFPKGDE